MKLLEMRMANTPPVPAPRSRKKMKVAPPPPPTNKKSAPLPPPVRMAPPPPPPSRAPKLPVTAPPKRSKKSSKCAEELQNMVNTVSPRLIPSDPAGSTPKPQDAFTPLASGENENCNEVQHCFESNFSDFKFTEDQFNLPSPNNEVLIINETCTKLFLETDFPTHSSQLENEFPYNEHNSSSTSNEKYIPDNTISLSDPEIHMDHDTILEDNCRVSNNEFSCKLDTLNYDDNNLASKTQIPRSDERNNSKIFSDDDSEDLQNALDACNPSFPTVQINALVLETMPSKEIITLDNNVEFINNFNNTDASISIFPNEQNITPVNELETTPTNVPPSVVDNTANRPLYKFFTPTVFQPYNPSAKPWNSNPTNISSKFKPVEYNVLSSAKINNAIYDKRNEFLTSMQPDTSKITQVDWPEITPPTVKTLPPIESQHEAISNSSHERAPDTYNTQDECEILKSRKSSSIISLEVPCLNDNEILSADTYPAYVRQPSPMLVKSSFDAVWSRTETPSDGGSSPQNCNYNEDIFSDIPSRPFGIAAVSPRKESYEKSQNKDIQKNFNEFTKHMLDNDYTLIDTPPRKKVLKKIRGPSKDEEDAVLSHLDEVIKDEIADIIENDISFEVDWSKCSNAIIPDDTKSKDVNSDVATPTESRTNEIAVAPPQDSGHALDTSHQPGTLRRTINDLNHVCDSKQQRDEQVGFKNVLQQIQEYGKKKELLSQSHDEIQTPENNSKPEVFMQTGTKQEKEEVPAELEEIEVQLTKMWGSLGIRLELIACEYQNEKFSVAVAQVMPGGAAEEAGTILAGDRLLEVNGERVGSSLEETVRLFRVGPDVVQLRLLRPRHERRRSRVDESADMGSTVSRHSEKGLCRRSQSSGNLAPLPRSKAQYVNSSSNNANTKLCGSLPNHLDRNDEDPENNNGDELRAKNMRNVELRLQTLLPPPQGAKNGEALQLLLPPPPLFHDPVNDQGYGSERSPEDENPPLLPQFPFISREAVFEVQLSKGSRGLGLSVTGGADSAEPWPGLVRVKRLFPHQPAWQDGRLAPGDVLLEANGTALTGLTNYEALEVLRTAPSLVTLRVCRPPAGTGLSSVAPEDVEHPLPPPRHRPAPLPPNKSTRPPASDIDDDDDESSTNSLLRPISEQGEFEISLTKVAGSLGFTLRKEDESVLGHYVRALVREPAVSDGRVKPGDRIVAVNGVDISPMSHEEAVAFLRKCGETVTLRLYRDKAQTPIAALSPTDGCKTFPRSRPLLRKEAMDMLSDLAGRKLAPSHDTTGRQRRASEGHPPAPVPTPSASGPSPSGTSPRRRRLARTPPSPVTDTVVQHNGIGNPVADVVEETGRASLKLSLQALASLDSTAGESTPRERPSSLDLSTPSSLRKHKFLFTSPPESATFSEFGDEDDSGSGVIAGLSPPNEYPGPSSLVSQPASMPPMRIDNELAPFSHRNPAYQSAAERPVTVIGEEGTSNQLCATQTSPAAVSDQDIPRRVFGQEGPQGLIKWKGIVFTPENEEAPKTPSSVTSSVPGGKSKSTTPTTPKPFVKLEDRDGQVLTVELTRGWNSRLGFTLHEGDEGKTLIKAIYPDSVAHRDGRLKQGDHVVMVNEESIEHLPTSEVIDLVRKIRGTVAITILRPR